MQFKILDLKHPYEPEIGTQKLSDFGGQNRLDCMALLNILFFTLLMAYIDWIHVSEVQNGFVPDILKLL